MTPLASKYRGGVGSLIGVRIVGLLFGALATAAPIPIRTVGTTLVLGPDSSAAGFTFLGDQLRVDSLTTGTPGIDARTWVPIQAQPTVQVLRYGTNRPDRNIGWVAQASATILVGVAPPLTPALLARNDLHLVADNLFVNAASEANSTNIERVDYIFGSSIAVNSMRSVVVMERGATSGHDGFSIAAITAVDINGTPTQYGPLVRIATGWANGSQYNLAAGNGLVFYRDGAAGTLVNSATISGQAIAGLMIPLADLVPLGTAVYGYSLFGNDVTASTNLTRPDLFPRNTASANGGIDLVAMNIGVVQEVPEPVPLITIGTALCALAMLRHRR